MLFSVTNRKLKRAFKKPGSTTVMKLVLQYQTAKDMSQATQEELMKVPPFGEIVKGGRDERDRI
ncbi:UNVERIFIED_CONTAM: excinuclease UvrABC nuclease subunit [Brevibacillus sp. OAP136]